MTAARSCFISQTDCNVARVVLKERRVAAQNSRWRVYFDHLVDDGGNEVEDYLVLEGRLARSGQIAGVDVLPVLGDKLLLLRVYRHPIARELWEVPRGFIDADEAAADAALRELTEETGLTCAPNDLVAFGTYAPEPGTMAAYGALFVAMRCEGTPRRLHDELGHGAFALFDRKEIADLIAAGEIAHGATQLLYYRFCESLR
jgi:ADP-ribose pyrophosphatase YjhB (NUDIX family)